MAAPKDRSRLFWKLQFAGWGTAGLLSVLFATTGYFEIRDALVVGIARVVFGFAVTCGLRLLYRRLRQLAANVWLLGVGVFLLCGVLGLADGAAMSLVGRLIGASLEDNSVRQFLVSSVFMRWMIFWLWSLLYFGINLWFDARDDRLRLAQLETEARTSELRLLRAQVNPHFLFNALNSILAESDNPPAVRSLTQALAEYLRFSLRQSGDSQPLGLELDALENYLQVEKARFEEKLDYRITADPAARQMSVPIALVQPLVENAIKYGQRTSPRPLHIAVTATAIDGELHVSVVNSGTWVEPEQAPRAVSTGTGLANLRRRLDLLHGAGARVAVESTDGKVRVQVTLPAENAEKDSK